MAEVGEVGGEGCGESGGEGERRRGEIEERGEGSGVGGKGKVYITRRSQTHSNIRTIVQSYTFE